MSNESKIQNFYKNQNIFITGGTGFMGKILVEKILRCCPDIGGVYILVRPKRNKQPHERYNDILKAPIFDKIRQEKNCDEMFQKFHCISGDITKENLNLSNDDLKLLQDSVTMVFHMAANVKFDQPLKPAVLLNLGGTMRLLNLACSFKNLKTFVHVSTSYCHCDETILEEKLYKAPHDPRKILDLMSWMDDDTLEKITPKLLKKSPNTYAYTKCLTEQLVSEYCQKLPIVIARPSIVVAAWQEPIPGWVDNLNGPTGLMVGAGKGVIRTMHCNPNLEADVIPVDVTINCLLAIGWKIGSTPKTNHVQVVHVTANKENPIKWGEALDMGRRHFYDNPFSVCLWYPGGSIKSNYFLHMLAVVFLHIIPAYLVDFLMIITFNKPFLVRTQKRIQCGLKVLQYYTTRPWYFHGENMKNIWNEMNEIDQKIFYTNQLKINYNDYLLVYVLGARKFCIREEPDTIPYARKVLKRLYYLDLFKNIVFGLLIVWLLTPYIKLFY